MRPHGRLEEVCTTLEGRRTWDTLTLEAEVTPTAVGTGGGLEDPGGPGKTLSGARGPRERGRLEETSKTGERGEM